MAELNVDLDKFRLKMEGSSSSTFRSSSTTAAETFSVLGRQSKRNKKISRYHRRRIMTEEKAKVLVTVWGTEFIKFLATLTVNHGTI